MALGRTARYYRDNPEARKKRLEYQKRYNARKSQIARRVENNRENKEHMVIMMERMFLIKAIK